MGQVIDSLDAQIEEKLNRQLTVMYPEVSEFFRMMVTSEGVARAEFGSDWQVRKVLQSGITGVVQMDSTFVTEGSATNDLANDQFFQYGTQGVYPDPLENFNPRPFRMQIGLKGALFTLPFTFADMNLDALPTAIGKIWAERVRGLARQIARTRITSFFSMDAEGQLATSTVADISAVETYSDPDGSITLTTDEKVINRFERGMQVDLYTDNSGTPQTQINFLTADGRIPCVVTAVNHFRNTVRIQYRRASGTPTITNGLFQDNLAGSGGSGAFSDGDVVHIFQRGFLADNSYTSGDEDKFSGLNTWLRDPSAAGDPGGTLYGINLTNYPELTSLILDNGAAALTEQDLALMLTKFHSGRRQYGMSVDTGVTTPGVFNAFVANRIGRERIDRTNSMRKQTKLGDSQTMIVVVNGTEVEIMLDDNVQSGHLYFVKRADNNFKRYVPPMPAGGGGQPEGFQAEPGLAEVEFIGRLAGYHSARVPYRDPTTGRSTQMVEYPGHSRMEVVPDQFSGIKVTNLAEDEVTPA